MRVYIAGPMSGYKNYNFQAFYDAEAWLKSQNHEPVNPARVDVELGKVIVRWVPSATDPGERRVHEVVVPGDEPFDWREAIERDLRLVDSCDAIYLLEGWRDSLGAQIEHDRAIVRGLEILGMADEPPAPATEIPVDEVMQARFEARNWADHETHLAKHNELRKSFVEDTDDRTNPKDLIGLTKPRVDLVPPAAILYMAKVMALGAEKYGPANWRENDVRHTVYLAAAIRHIFQALDGQKVDPESGQPHEAHAASCMAILLDAMANGNLIDDLPTPGPASQVIEDLTERSPS